MLSVAAAFEKLDPNNTLLLFCLLLLLMPCMAPLLLAVAATAGAGAAAVAPLLSSRHETLACPTCRAAVSGLAAAVAALQVQHHVHLLYRGCLCSHAPCAYREAFPVLYWVTFMVMCFLQPLQKAFFVFGTFTCSAGRAAAAQHSHADRRPSPTFYVTSGV